MAGCRTCGGSKPRLVIPSGGGSSGSNLDPGALWEVISAKGTSTGRRFSSKTAADGFASRIGGTVQRVG